jgi:phosphohistidine phosphatase
MRLLIVRHADAGDREDWEKSGRPDEQRPLSEKGIERMRAAVKGLVELVPDVEVIVTSPYVRAAQTAEIVFAVYAGKPKQETSKTLEPEEQPDRFVAWLRGRKEETVAAVGHEPHLSTLVTWLMCGEASSQVDLKKGAACLLELDGQPRKGEAVLLWLMGPKQLARLA